MSSTIISASQAVNQGVDPGALPGTALLTEAVRRERVAYTLNMMHVLAEDALTSSVADKYAVSTEDAADLVDQARREHARQALLERWGVFQLNPDSKRRKFYAPQLAKLLDDEHPVARGADGSLYSYTNGVYRPEAEERLRRRVKGLLAADWSTRHEAETIAYLESAQGLIPHPSRERINCTNGVYNRMTGELEPHSPEDRTPVQIGADFDADATCPKIEAFLVDVLPADEDRQLFYEIAGYLLIPDNSLQKAFMFSGSGANGKTTALGVLEALLGQRNVAHVALQQLDEDRFAAGDLYGRLANVYGDLDRRALASTSIFKGIVGGDEIRAERKFRDAFSFRPYARLLFSANELPPTPDGTPAFYRRWVVLPFTRRFSAEVADPAMLAKLTTDAELSGLLNRAVGALDDLQRRGHFPETASTRAAAEAFKLDTDSVAGFLADAVEFDPTGFTRRSALYDAYKLYCQQSNRGPLGRRRFLARVRDDHPELEEVKRDGYDGFAGLGLLRDALEIG